MKQEVGQSPSPQPDPKQERAWQDLTKKILKKGKPASRDAVKPTKKRPGK